MSINRVNATGNLTRDSELSYTAQGAAVLTFGIAINDRRKDSQTGEWRDDPQFVDCVMFGKRAEAIQSRLYKGAKIALEGKLRQHSWQDEATGQNRSKIEIDVREVEFLTGAVRREQPRPTTQADPYGEDIPF